MGFHNSDKEFALLCFTVTCKCDMTAYVTLLPAEGRAGLEPPFWAHSPVLSLHPPYPPAQVSHGTFVSALSLSPTHPRTRVRAHINSRLPRTRSKARRGAHPQTMQSMIAPRHAGDKKGSCQTEIECTLRTFSPRPLYLSFAGQVNSNKNSLHFSSLSYLASRSRMIGSM